MASNETDIEVAPFEIPINDTISDDNSNRRTRRGKNVDDSAMIKDSLRKRNVGMS